MGDRFKPIECNNGDVLDFGDNTYKIGKFKQAIDTSFNPTIEYKLNQELSSKGIHIKESPNGNWFHKGIDCEILTLGSQSWKKGKVKIKISVEFYIEEEDIEITNSKNSEITEPESPLDDLRRMIHE
ncbi:KGK domain-containing protein [Nostoc sp. 'Lobaria pulmonaria (5183) cyanobiont']|uniref:KGK domain-containing protein n=1 Tax=Nostoc sp. 'Lobaria pulmonaria (5183) cyanobiont' TaxID=1618022 RepID=UPI000CF32381|nr:KGK domain-containing protein [Nostoc sp. 'Lobaria pulmonaria (5183) cyanobiont']AVH73572.1 KGK family protein [Nostoc sp. 'Lobaria pulmonaria (5183) cyanobiont']